MPTLSQADRLPEFLRTIGAPSAACTLKGALVIVQARASDREVWAAKHAGFQSTTCRKFGKTWTTSVRLEHLISDDEGADIERDIITSGLYTDGE